MVVLYSNHCPKCDIVKAKLDAKNVKYEYVDDLNVLADKDYDPLPVIEVDGVIMKSMIEINDFINSL